jgi:hypothetical protein
MVQYLRRVTKFGAPSYPQRPVLAPELPTEPAPIVEEVEEAVEPPRPRGRPRLEGSEDRKPMGHRVPSALLRQLTLIAAELAVLEDRKVQQQDLVALALEEFIARQRVRIDELRRQRQ